MVSLNKLSMPQVAFVRDLLFGLAVAFAATLPVQAAEIAGGPSARDQAQQLMSEFFAATANIHDYTHVMTKQQRIKNEWPPEEVLSIKHRQAPECRYMAWIGDLKKGREMIYCADRYDGKIQAHDSGLLGFIHASFSPDSGLYQRTGQLHPIDDTGLYSMVRLIQQDYSFLAAHPELPIPKISHVEVVGAPSSCIDIEKGADLFSTYHAGRRQICLDDKLHLPTELKIWNQEGLLMEQYRFSNYRLNVGLTDADFDTGNRAYHF